MKDRERIWMYYAAGRVSLPLPRYLCVNATLRCDGKCGHCGIWHEDPGPELSAAEFGRILSSPFFQRIETAWITGGEPTLREDLGELARNMTAALPALTTLGLATNALDPQRALDRVKAMIQAVKPNRQGLFIHISLDGVDEAHDQVRRKKGAFAAVTDTLQRLQALAAEHPQPKIEIGLNCVIQPKNVSGLSHLYAFAKERGLPLLFNVVLVTDQIYRNADAASSLTLSETERDEIIAFLNRIIPESPAPFQYQYRTIQAVLAGKSRPRRCLTLYSTININADGSFLPCPAASDIFPKNLLTEDAASLWRSEEAKKMRARIHREFCPSCMLSCSLGDSMPLWEWLRGGWEGKPGRGKGKQNV